MAEDGKSLLSVIDRTLSPMGARMLHRWVLFMTGVNVGFSPLGYVLGEKLSRGDLVWLLPPLAMVMGWYIINAERRSMT